jgi:hypothetical protein
MTQRLRSAAAILVVYLLLLTPAVVLGEKPPPSPSTGKITKITGNSFDWTGESGSWKCIPPKGQATIKGLDGVKEGDTVEATFTHAGGNELYVSEVKLVKK